ncbi:MAG: asparagine synthase (glutamine-hydrolyzing) [Alphaproteobacteria bacterium]|nr:asparagine synthase (glutamine-hydrolyzing) [Alphaproteobacteria bacterium]
MCGIAGIYKNDGPNLTAITDRMTDAIAHRGPDSRGIWVDNGVGLGHRRLAIRDLTPAGHQPMISSCDRFVIAYNGEVYSHKEMIQDLASCGRHVKSTCDTEVILEACAQWGVEACAKRLIGMFAFALFDRKTRDLYLVRDRLGIKPIYWGMHDGQFIFGSELSSLKAAGGWAPRVDRNALSAFMRHNYIPAPYSIYQGVYKLEPGSILQLSAQGKISITRFWDLETVAKNGMVNPIEGSESEKLNQLDDLLKDAVLRRMEADVPLGSLLSGGVDSSLVTALMAEQSSRPINTFSIGFEEKEFNEAPYARDIATHLSTNHTELYVTPAHALGIVSKLSSIYDEPFSDSSQIPTFAVCELTKQHVTVVLSGDGGDELFAGYNRYAQGLRMWKMFGSLPDGFKAWAAQSLLSRSMDSLDEWGRWIPSRLRPPQFGNKLHKLAQIMTIKDADEMYRNLVSHAKKPDDLVIGANEYKGILWDSSIQTWLPDFRTRMQFYDTKTYLPDDILTKVDRASMRVALEVRVPLLDHRLVEYTYAMPQNFKVRSGVSKWALRESLYKRVPKSLIDRPKMGFGVPLDAWLRGPLKDWAASLLEKNRLESQGLFAVKPIQDMWQQHLQGVNMSYSLWNILMVQSWLDANPDVLV